MAVRNGFDGLSMDLLLDRIILMAAFGDAPVANACPSFERAIAEVEKGGVHGES
jgi:hypothetical protein